MRPTPTGPRDQFGGLARFLDLPGGVSFDEAIRTAEERVCAMHDLGRARIYQALVQTAAVLGEPPLGASANQRQRLMKTIDDILSVAGLLGGKRFGARRAVLLLLD